MTDRALVTGATGFIGAHLVQTLLERDVQVSCLVRQSSDLSALPAAEVRLIYADLAQPGSLPASIPEVDWVFHLAGLTKSHSASELQRANEGGTRNLLQAVSGLHQPPIVIFVSSLSAAGPSTDKQPLLEHLEPRPVSRYGRSKLAAERVAVEFAPRLPVSIVRPPIVFGERDTDVYEMYRMASLGVFLIPVPPSRRYSLIHARDLAEFLLLVAEHGERVPPEIPGEDHSTGRYYVGYDCHPTYPELGQRMARALGRERLIVLRIPQPLGYTAAAVSEFSARLRGRPPGIINLDKVQEGRAGSWTCSPRKARDQLGYSPGTGLDPRLKQTAEWYQNQGWL